jgi:hypothetical protein
MIMSKNQTLKMPYSQGHAWSVYIIFFLES